MNINKVALKEKLDNMPVSQTFVNVGVAGDKSKNLYNTAATLEKGVENVTEYRENITEVKKEKSQTKISFEDIKTLVENVSTDDYMLFEKMGFAPDKDNPADIVTVNDRIKVLMAVSGGESYGDIDIDTLKNMYGDVGTAYQIAGKLRENGITPDEKNIEQVTETLNKAQSLGEMSDGAKLYLLNNNLTVSVDNVYLAKHAEAAGSVNKNENILSIGEWSVLKEQISDMLEKSGMEVTDSKLQNAKWMIENKVPVTVGNIIKMDMMDKLSAGYSQQEWIDGIVENIAAGGLAGTTLAAGTEPGNIAQDFVETVENVANEDLQYILKNNHVLNIKNMKEYNENYKDNQENNPENLQGNESEQELIKAKRQLEEIRLMMTSKVGLRMLANGINIDTEPIQNIVDELKKMESEYAGAIFDMAGAEKNQEREKMFSDTMNAMEIMKSVPAYVLGNVMSGETEFTVESVNQTGTKLASRLDMANRTYETMQTEPRKDLGDSLTKAFESVDDILRDMDIEITKSSERAVRILVYNNMELTQENITAIKQLDMEVSTLIDNMKPKTVVHLISNGINPLNTDIHELNDKLTEINNAIDADDSESYSEYLWKLSHNYEISEEDRQAYIGVYRLLNLVSKGDRTVIGAIVGEGADVTMNNMLRALRTNNAKGMDKVIDDEAEITEKVVVEESSLSSQLSGFMNDSGAETEDNSDVMNELHHKNEDHEGVKLSDSDEYAYHEENLTERYISQELQKIKNNITPQKLSEVIEKGDIMNMSLEWLAEYMSDVSEESYNEDARYYAEQIRMMQESVRNVDEEVLKVLIDSGQNPTIENIMTVSYLMSDNNKIFNKIKKMTDDKKQLDNISKIERLESSEEDIIDAYESIADYAKRYADNAALNGNISDMQELIMLKKSMNMISTMSKNAMYHVPVEIDGNTAGVRVTVVKGGTDKGKVTVDVYSEVFGKISAEFNMKGDVLDGIIAADTKETVEIIEKNIDKLECDFEESGYNVKGVSGQYCSNVHYGLWNIKEENEERVSNSRLYNVAKIFIKNIKQFEKV